MPRDLSSAALTKIAQTKGNSPVFVIEVQWIKDSPWVAYADKDFAGIYGKILEVSGLEDVVNVSQGSDSQQISVTLDDTDGSLKPILDNNDIHKRPCKVYQAFDGLSLDDKFLLFRGVINSPLEWDEGDRTLKFTVISQIEDAEVGFSVEEGDVPGADDSLIGKPWPLCFGTVINVPALKATGTKHGVLATGVGIKDFTLLPRLNVAQKLACAQNFVGFVAHNSEIPPFSLIIEPVYDIDRQCERDKCESIQSLELQIAEQSAFEFTTIRVFGGENFPQNTSITLNIGGGRFTGSFDGDIFTITDRHHPDQGPDGKVIRSSTQKLIKSTCGDAPGTLLPSFLPFEQRNVKYWLNFYFNDTNLDLRDDWVPPAPSPPDGGAAGPETINKYKADFTHSVFSAMMESNFFWANPGTEVTLVADKELVYIANILPSTVLRVAAYRNLEAGRKLLTVPADYYFVRQVDYTGYQVTEVVLPKALSQIDETWEDDIYVTLTSSVGPNTVDELEWLIDTYTEFETDTTSFDHVRDLIDNYPMHFLMPGRKNIVNVLQEMAEQARCAVWLRDDKFFIKYLAEEPTADDTITPSDVLANTLKITHTPTEDLVTKFVVEWKSDYAVDEPNKLILRHNVAKYGTHEQTYDYYTFNILDLVRKAATFWLIRRANTWRKCSFQTPITKLASETFDTLQVDLDAVTPIGVKAIVESANYDSDARAIQFDCWTPLKSGTLVPYDFAWPADVDEDLIFPTIDEREQGFGGSGKGPSFSVIVPNNHPLSEFPPLLGGFQLSCNGKAVSGSIEKGQCRKDHGTRKPSDRGDTKPSPKASSDNAGDISGGTDPVNSNKDCCGLAQEALNAAKKAQQDANRDNRGAGGGGGGEQSQEDGNKKLPDQGCAPGPCQHVVRIQYITISRIVRPNGVQVPDQNGEVHDEPPIGRVIAGDPAGQECFMFNSSTQAQTFAHNIAANAQQKQQNFQWSVGEKYPQGISTEAGSNTDENGDACVEPTADQRVQTGHSGP